MWKKIRPYLISLAVVLAVVLIVTNIAKSSPKKVPFTPPDIGRGPARVYGSVEPKGGEVYVSPALTRPVARIHVREGDTLKRGQAICSLDNELERSQLAAAAARAEALKKTFDLSRKTDVLNKKLYDNQSISEFDYNQIRLKTELDSLNWIAAQRDADLAQARLGQTDLRSPIDGRLYKFAVRLGQTLPAGENSLIVLGRTGYQVRLYIESFWIDRIDVGDEFDIFDSERGSKIGTSRVVSKSAFLGGKSFKTNDLYERFDTKYQEAILDLAPVREPPIGLLVYAELTADSMK